VSKSWSINVEENVLKKTSGIIAWMVALVIFGAAFKTTAAITLIQASKSPTFEVASIKPAEPSNLQFVAPRCHGTDSKFLSGDPGESVPLGRCAGIGMGLNNLMALAYDVASPQIQIANGGPAWVKNIDGRFTLMAKAADSSSTTEQQLRVMLQGLLADRFELKFHRETRLTDGFAMTVAKSGPKLKKSEEGAEETPFRVGTRRDHIDLVVKRLSMAKLALFFTMSAELGGGPGPVVDKTGLEGDFAFSLNSDEKVGPSLFTAMQEQLGLKLEPQKVPIERLVIDSAVKPSPNQ
jgi:uncharacterized protein (TIGR03435 family)